MTVQASLRIECTLVGDDELIHSIIVDGGSIFFTFHFSFFTSRDRRCQATEGQSHEDAVEPNLIGVDSFVPEHLVCDGARLVLQLFHHRLHGQQVLGLGPLLIHAGDEMAGADVVEVIVENVIVANLSVGINHRIGIFLTVFPDFLASVFKIGVEHAFKFDTHHIAPLGSIGKVEQVAFRHTLHLRIGKPLAIMLIRLLV